MVGQSGQRMPRAASAEHWTGTFEGKRPFQRTRYFPMRELMGALTLLVCLCLAAPCQAQVTGSGMTGTVPVWTSSTSIGSTSAINGIASENLWITGPGPWIDVKAYGAVGDGTTDDTTAIKNAIAACPSSPTTGCTVFFPDDPGSYLVSSSTGNAALTVSTPNVVLKGECAPAQSPYTACSQLLASSVTATYPILYVTPPTGSNTLNGFRIQDLGFQDRSSSHNLAGAVQLNFVDGFVLDDVYCDNFAAGYCMQFDGSSPGGSGFTQFGTLLNPYTTNVKFPIQTDGLTSSVNLFGGELNCATLNASSVPSGTIGMDIGATYPGTSTNPNVGGEWGAWGTHILNCATGISLKDTAAFSDYAAIENTVTSVSGSDAVVIDGSVSGTSTNPPNHTGGTTISGSISGYPNGLKMTSNSHKARILFDWSAVTSPIDSTSDFTTIAIPSSVILSPSIGGGTSQVGAQIPTDLTFTGEAAPSASLSGAGRVYFDSTADAFEVSRNGGAFGFQGFAASPGLTSNEVVLGQGNGDMAPLGSYGSSGQCLMSNGSSSVPAWGGCGDVGNQDRTDVNLAISNALIFTVSDAGRYVVNLSLTITATDSSGAVVTPQIAWTNEGVVRSVSGSGAAFASTANSSVLSVPVYADSSSTIRYSTTLSHSLTTGTYSVHAWVVRQQ